MVHKINKNKSNKLRIKSNKNKYQNLNKMIFQVRKMSEMLPYLKEYLLEIMKKKLMKQMTNMNMRNTTYLAVMMTKMLPTKLYMEITKMRPAIHPTGS